MEKPNATPNKLRYASTADGFKPLSEVMLPDPRHKSPLFLNSDEFHIVDLEGNHERMCKLILNASVPKDVQVGFDTARNLYLYSWFVYRFKTVAMLQAFATLDYAIGKRMLPEKAKKTHNLSPRLKFAISEGWLHGEGLRQYQRLVKILKERVELPGDSIDLDEVRKKVPDDWLHHLKDVIPNLRNSIAHGTPLFERQTTLIMEVCCDLINQLFPEKVVG